MIPVDCKDFENVKAMFNFIIEYVLSSIHLLCTTLDNPMWIGVWSVDETGIRECELMGSCYQMRKELSHTVKTVAYTGRQTQCA